MSGSLHYLILIALVLLPFRLFATENLSHITQAGGTILFAEDFEDNATTEDEWPGSPGWFKWISGPVDGQIGDRCETNTDRRYNAIDADNSVISERYIGPTDSPAPPSMSTVAWSDTAYQVTEGSALITATIERAGNSFGAVTVDWCTLGGSASQGEDYQSVNWTTVVIVDGKTSKTVNIQIKDDTLAEGDEFFTLCLTDPTHCAMGTQVEIPVTIVDDDGELSTPQAKFSFKPTPATGFTPLAVQFIDTSTGGPTSWKWDFDGDGAVDATEQNPQHTYSNAGSYITAVTVTNSIGTDTTTMPITVTPASEGHSGDDSDHSSKKCFIDMVRDFSNSN